MLRAEMSELAKLTVKMIVPNEEKHQQRDGSRTPSLPPDSVNGQT